MLRRAWYLLTGGWALLVVTLTREDMQHARTADQHFWWVITFGPLALPWVAGLAMNYIRWGSFRRPRPAPGQWRSFKIG